MIPRFLAIALAASTAASAVLACGGGLHGSHEHQPAHTATIGESEEPFLANVTRLTSPSRFSRAGEAYFSPTSDWIIFQAVPADEEPAADDTGERGNPVYAMYVAKLERDADGRVAGAEEPIRISPRGSANTCGWFHPSLPGVVLFGSTLDEPTNPDRDDPAYQRDESDYSWDFPRNMDIVTRTVPAIVRDQVEDPELRSALLARDDVREPKRMWQRDGYDAEGSWSPDGRFVLYTAVDPETGDGDIYVRDLWTNTATPLVTAPGYDGGPFFNHDGTRITYRSDRRGDDLLQVFTAELTFDDRGVPTGIASETQLTDNEHVNWAPFWHPSGAYLVYATSQVSHFNYEIFAIPSRMNATGKTPSPVRLTHAAGFDGLPVFNEDGSLMMWTGQREGSSQLYIAETVASAPTGLDLRSEDAGLATTVTIADSEQPIVDALAAATPNARTFLQHINVLASEWLGGRFPGTPGIETAERYIVHHFREAGLEPAFTDRAGNPRFFQPFTVKPPGSDRSVIARNVGAFLPGTGALADRFVIIGAHHDGLGTGTVGSRTGQGEIHEGADDNASGTALVLLLARQLAERYAALPEDADARTVLFATFSAEEIGLLGARHLASEPPLDLGRTDLMINFDMVGRITNNRISMSGLATGDALDALTRPAIDASQLDVVAPDGLTARSDHAAFYERDVPTLFFIIDPFHDDYHTPSDEAWKLNPDGAAMLAELAGDILLNVAQHPSPIAFNEIEGFGGSRGSPMADISVRFGVMPGNYNDNRPGVAISRVSPGTSADNAGIRDGDRLIAWEGQAIEDIGAWMGMLAEHEPGDTVNVTVERDGEEVELPVTLQARN